MHHLAAAIIDTAAMLELSTDDMVDPDVAVRGLELIAASLTAASPEEVQALRDILVSRKASATSDDARAFFDNFLMDFGLEHATQSTTM